MSKYNAVRTTLDGITFASKAEARRYQELKLLAQGGSILDLQLQPVFILELHGKKIGKYIADFMYIENNKVVIEDVKGIKTPVYNLKKKLMKAIYDIDILETK